MTRWLVFRGSRRPLGLAVAVLSIGFGAAAIAWSGMSGGAVAADAPHETHLTLAEASKVLESKGLTKLKPSSTSVPWVLGDDAKVCEKLAPFLKAEAADRTAAAKARGESTGTSKDRDTLEKAKQRYQQEKAFADKPATIPPAIMRKFHSQQEMMQALQQDLNDQVNTINRLAPKLNGRFAGDMAPALKSAIIEWMTARNDLIAAYLQVEPDFTALSQEYKDVAKDPEVVAALKELGRRNHLGSNAFERDQKAMAAAAKSVNSGAIPFIRQGLADSVGGLLNDTLPVVVKIETTNPKSPNWAPVGVLAKAGIMVDPHAPVATLSFSGNGKRTIQCRPVIVPKLRLGKYTLENLKFLAMPDSAKDLGVQIS